MGSQGVWDDAKDSEEQKLLARITDLDGQHKKGSITMSEAKEIAIDLRRIRAEYRHLIAERNVLDGNTVEGQAVK